MNNYLTRLINLKRLAVWTVAIFCIFFVVSQPRYAEACMKTPPPEKIKAIIIGDRVVDIAYNLGVLPEAMSVRGSLWPMAKQLRTVSQILGCPKCIVAKKGIIPNALAERGIKRVIVEKNDSFCLYRPKMKPENIAPILAGMDVTIEYVDFSQGLETAVRQTAKLLNRESRADQVIENYKKNMAMAKAMLPASALGKKVIIFSGTYQPSTGKCLLRVEAPGGYSDQFLLKPLGCTNVGDSFKPGNKEASNGHYQVRKQKNGFDLTPLIKANPDVIVATGDGFAVQRAIQVYAKKHPAILDVTAVKNMAVYSLPFYADSSVIEYPDVLKKWTVALSK